MRTLTAISFLVIFCACSTAFAMDKDLPNKLEVTTNNKYSIPLNKPTVLQRRRIKQINEAQAQAYLVKAMQATSLNNNNRESQNNADSQSSSISAHSQSDVASTNANSAIIAGNEDSSGASKNNHICNGCCNCSLS